MVALGTLIRQAKTVRCGNNDYPILSMTMHNGLVFQEEKFKKIVASKDRSNYKVVYRNQLVVGFPIDEGVLATQRIADAGIVSPAYGIWDIDQEKILPEFLEYALRCERSISYYKAKLRGSTARRRSLPTSTLLSHTIPLPNTEEQRHILNLIHKAESVISMRTQELDKLDELVNARFVELFESSKLSEETTLASITKQVKVGFVGTCEKYYTDESGVPMIRTGNITTQGINLNDLKYVTRDFHERNRKSQLHTGDLLIARHGSNGQANVYSGPEAQCLNAVVIIPNQNVASSIFLTGLINSPMVKEQIDQTLVGSTQRVINTKSIANLKVRIPAITVQKQYEAFTERVNGLKAAVQKALDEAQLLFDSLMQKYFG